MLGSNLTSQNPDPVPYDLIFMSVESSVFSTCRIIRQQGSPLSGLLFHILFLDFPLKQRPYLASDCQPVQLAFVLYLLFRGGGAK